MWSVESCANPNWKVVEATRWRFSCPASERAQPFISVAPPTSQVQAVYVWAVTHTSRTLKAKSNNLSYVCLFAHVLVII